VRNRFRLWSSVEARQRFGDDPIARRGRGLDERYVAEATASSKPTSRRKRSSAPATGRR
jgi:hypothetical protein